MHLFRVFEGERTRRTTPVSKLDSCSWITSAIKGPEHVLLCYARCDHLFTQKNDQSGVKRSLHGDARKGEPPLFLASGGVVDQAAKVVRGPDLLVGGDLFAVKILLPGPLA